MEKWRKQQEDKPLLKKIQKGMIQRNIITATILFSEKIQRWEQIYQVTQK